MKQDKVDESETVKSQAYNMLLANGAVLPKYNSRAISIKSLTRMSQNAIFITVYEGELSDQINKSERMIVSNNFAYYCLNIFIYSKFGKIFPFSHVPDRVFISTMLQHFDPDNSMGLLYQRKNIQEKNIIHLNFKGRDIEIDLLSNSIKTFYEQICNSYSRILTKKMGLVYLEAIGIEKIKKYQSKYFKVIENDREHANVNLESNMESIINGRSCRVYNEELAGIDKYYYDLNTTICGGSDKDRLLLLVKHRITIEDNKTEEEKQLKIEHIMNNSDNIQLLVNMLKDFNRSDEPKESEESYSLHSQSKSSGARTYIDNNNNDDYSNFSDSEDEFGKFGPSIASEKIYQQSKKNLPRIKSINNLIKNNDKNSIYTTPEKFITPSDKHNKNSKKNSIKFEKNNEVISEHEEDLIVVSSDSDDNDMNDALTISSDSG